MTFCWPGLAVVAAVLLPNLIWAVKPPADAQTPPQVPGRLLPAIENGGRVLYTLLLFLFSPVGHARTWGWLAAAAVFLLLYYGVWLRYFLGGRRLADLYRPLAFIPVPLAVFPVLHFMCAALWLGNYWALAAAVLFGVAHIWQSLRIWRVVLGNAPS